MNVIINGKIVQKFVLRNRSFKGANRKRPRTETAEGATSEKKEEKEDKEVNGENKEGTSKENSKEVSDKKSETIVKLGGETSHETSSVPLNVGETKGKTLFCEVLEY